MRRLDYFKPQSLEELWDIKKIVTEAGFIAGGTDVLVQIKDGEFNPPALISLRSIPGLNQVEINSETRIGTTVTIHQLCHHSSLGLDFPVLIDACKSLGSVQIRNSATIGGNLCNCSPAADMALPLLVLDAKLRLQTHNSSRDMPIHEFFLGPGKSCLSSDEILTDILLDRPDKNSRSVFLKKGRVKMDLAIASVAVRLEIEGKNCRKARIAAGSVAPVPLRLLDVEQLIEGKPLNSSIISEAQKNAKASVEPITDVRASKEYRREIIGIYVKRALEKILEEIS